MNAIVHGTVATGFESLRPAFAQAFAGKPGMGAALAIRHRGHLVVDLWGGLADARTDAPWTQDTASVIFSCTKGLSAILAARLVQEGLLDYDAPVARYWPEFAAAGKSQVTVAHLLAHRSGVSAPRLPLTPDEILDWAGVTQRLAAQEPLWEPGSGYAYHAITHGWLIGEVIRRVTGLTVGEYFTRLVSGPLGGDAWIGLPASEHYRVAHMRVGATLAQLVAQQAAARTTGITDWSEQAMTLGGALPHELVGDGVGFNSPRVLSEEIPGAGGVATARALAGIWSATFEDSGQGRLLNTDTVARATRVQSEGPPVFDVPGPWPRWGMGFQLDSEPRRYVTPQGYGHDGAGGQVAFADPGVGIGFAFLTNQMEAIDDQRGTHLVTTLREAVAALPYEA